jgi:hypothetical protein
MKVSDSLHAHRSTVIHSEQLATCNHHRFVYPWAIRVWTLSLVSVHCTCHICCIQSPSAPREPPSARCPPHYRSSLAFRRSTPALLISPRCQVRSRPSTDLGRLTPLCFTHRSSSTTEPTIRTIRVPRPAAVPGDAPTGLIHGLLTEKPGALVNLGQKRRALFPCRVQTRACSSTDQRRCVVGWRCCVWQRCAWARTWRTCSARSPRGP